jgi:hypothetical protein
VKAPHALIGQFVGPDTEPGEVADMSGLKRRSRISAVLPGL